MAVTRRAKGRKGFSEHMARQGLLDLQNGMLSEIHMEVDVPVDLIAVYANRCSVMNPKGKRGRCIVFFQGNVVAFGMLEGLANIAKSVGDKAGIEPFPTGMNDANDAGGVIKREGKTVCCFDEQERICFSGP